MMEFDRDKFSRIYNFTVTIPLNKKQLSEYTHHIPTYLAVGNLFYSDKFYLVIVDDIQILLKNLLLNDYHNEDYTRVSELLESVSEWKNEVKKFNTAHKEELEFEMVTEHAYNMKCMQLSIGKPKGTQKLLYPIQLFCIKGNEKDAMREYFMRTNKHGLSTDKRKAMEERYRQFLYDNKPMWDWIVKDPRLTNNEVKYFKKS